jgi:hypothetical protein
MSPREVEKNPSRTKYSGNQASVWWPNEIPLLVEFQSECFHIFSTRTRNNVPHDLFEIFHRFVTRFRLRRCADCSARRARFSRWTARLRCVASPADSCTRLRPILQVARRVMPPVACGILPGKREPARMRGVEGGRDVLKWVCVRGIRPHVWCVLAGTIPVARRLRVGRAEGRCLAAMAQAASNPSPHQKRRPDFSRARKKTSFFH